MKKQLLCLWVALCLPITLLFAQSDTTQYKERVDYYLGNVNKTLIPTQILYDRVFPLAGLQGFNQNGRSDTSSYQHFNQAYFGCNSRFGPKVR